MFIHLDIDYFFAQAEKLRHPELENKVIIVCVFSGRTKDSGVVSTVNYEGRKYGVHSGMPIFQAKQRAPQDTVFLPVDHDYYGELSSKINEHIKSNFKKAIQTSIDEWFIESDDREIVEIAKKLKLWIFSELGLTCSVGIAPSMLGAKMAAGKSKPDGLLALDIISEANLIENSDLQNVIGIGVKTANALRELGAQKVGELKKIDKVVLVEAFGKKTGAWLISLAEGKYSGLLGYGSEEQSEVSRIGTLKNKTRNLFEMLSKIAEMEKDNKEWLKANNKAFRTIIISFVTEDMKQHTKSNSFRNPKSYNDDFEEEERKLISQFLEENSLNVHRIGIKYANLVDMAGQRTLAEEL